jgi:hypothetical protein
MRGWAGSPAPGAPEEATPAGELFATLQQQAAELQQALGDLKDRIRELEDREAAAGRKEEP